MVDAWPVEVERIALVGHSMGGLVARSACHYAGADGAAGSRRVRHVVSLGTPHMGAPLAQAVHVLQRRPRRRARDPPVRRASCAAAARASATSATARSWTRTGDGRDPDALRAAALTEVPLLEGATHCFVAATITRSAGIRSGRLLGDVLVLEASASGRSRDRHIPFREEHGMHLGGAHHLALLNHPEVYERLSVWLAADQPL